MITLGSAGWFPRVNAQYFSYYTRMPVKFQVNSGHPLRKARRACSGVNAE